MKSNDGIRTRSRASIRSIAVLLLALVVASVGLDRPAHAADGNAEPDMKAQLQDVWNRDLFTDDWGGMRTYLHDHGIDISLRLSQYGQGVASGGVDKNGEYGGTMDYRVNADLRKLFRLWDGLSVSMHARTRWGSDVSADSGPFALENAGMIMQLPGDYSGTDITGLLVNQTFPIFDSHQGLLSLGKIDVIDAVTLFFPYVGHGQEGFANVNALVSALPWFGAVNGLSLYGGWLATFNKEYGMGQSAFLFTGTQNVTTSWTDTDSFEDGAWMAAFHRFFWKLDDKTGYFMVFGGGSTREQNSNDPHDHAIIPGEGIVSTDQKRPWDIAAYIYQILWQAEDDPNRKATIMIGGSGGPDNPQFSNWNFFTAVEAFGPMASRPGDRMGVSGWVNGISENFRDLVSPVDDVRAYSWGIEFYYNIEINKYLHLTPDLQLVQNGNEDDDLAVIPGIRLVMDF
jgi:porin